jgi:hypothetical protein
MEARIHFKATGTLGFKPDLYSDLISRYTLRAVGVHAIRNKSRHSAASRLGWLPY